MKCGCGSHFLGNEYSEHSDIYDRGTKGKPISKIFLNDRIKFQYNSYTKEIKLMYYREFKE